MKLMVYESTDFGNIANSGSKWMIRELFKSLSQ